LLTPANWATVISAVNDQVLDGVVMGALGALGPFCFGRQGVHLRRPQGAGQT